MMRRRHRIGCVVPAINVVAEDDFIALCPADTGVHFARADVDRSRPMAEQFQQMIDDAPQLGATLAKAGVGVVAFACTSASFFRGLGSDAAISDAITAAAGLPAVTTAGAVSEALRALGARRVGIATPYVEWVYEAEREFFTAAGFEVVAVNGLGRGGGADIHTLSDDEIRALAADAAAAEADALFVSCTDLPVLGLIAELERRHARPVVTSNQATFWACARTLGMAPIAGYGRLLSGRL